MGTWGGGLYDDDDAADLKAAVALLWFIRCNGSAAGAAFPANDSFYFDPWPVLATLLA
jgi:hypothetical protein